MDGQANSSKALLADYPALDKNETVYQCGARGPLPLGIGVNGPLHWPYANTCAMLALFARAMNPCLVASGPGLFAQPTVRGVAGRNPSRWKTVAVILDVSTYLGAAVPSSSSGHLASSPVQVCLDGKPPALAVGYVSLCASCV
jgi:hypothetical protein